MIYILKNYQRKAVDELKICFDCAFKSKIRKNYVFKSPTGSGKTFMVSSLFEELADEYGDVNFCVIWACPGKGELHKQSFDAVKKYLGGNPVCSLLEEDFFGYRKSIKDKEIVFVNWEKLIQKDSETGEWVNNLMRDQEGMNFLDVIQNTKRNGTKVILVVDESHIGASMNARIQQFKETIIKPDIVLEMSATPLSNHIDVSIDPRDVVAEGMIKEDVIVNKGISASDHSLEEKDSELLILEKGFEKRNEIVNRYNELGVNVNPLVLIQIPNVGDGEAKKLVIKDFLREHGITEDNGKLKFWCDDSGHFDKKKIKDNNDITEYLVFKTAVATGWDCPRAHILVKFREGKSETFETQTIGRILRTAEAKSYSDDLLDNAYIFTNIWTFETRSDSYNPNRIKTEFAKMRQGYNKLNVWGQTQLKSFYRSRQGDYNSADSRYGKYFLSSFMKRFKLVDEDKYAKESNTLKEKLEREGLNLDLETTDKLIEETSLGIESVDNEHQVSGKAAIVKMSDNDVQSAYNALIRENLSGLAYVRSKSPINSAILDAFGIFYDVFPRADRVKCVMRIVVNNRDVFAEIISESTRDFRELLSEEAGKKGEIYDFKIDDIRPYSTETHTILSSSKSLYQPLYVLKDDQGNPDNGLEKSFLNYLDKSDQVNWYWENGTELMRINFGIPYNNGINTFQPDFIVKFSDGSVGIFDTKPVGYRVDDTTIKANALANSLVRINTDRGSAPKVVGGIVVKDGTQFYYYPNENYHDYAASHDGWLNFNELLRDVEKNLSILNLIKEYTND